MKKFTFLITFLLISIFYQGFAQKVIVIGMNHSSADGFSFVAAENLSVGEVIYFTDNEYNDASNAFTFNGATSGEAVVIFTVTSAISAGNVVFVNETSSDVFSVTTSGGSGTAVISTFTDNGGFSLATNGDNVYAYSDTDENPVNGITEIYSVLYTGSGEIPTQNGGLIPADANPVSDFPNAIVVDGFPDDGDINVGPDRVEYVFNPATLRDGVSKTAFENPSNYLSYVSNQSLSILPFTNLNLSGANPVLTLATNVSSVIENSGSDVTYTFLLSENAATDITVNFEVGGTAIYTTDFTQSGAASFDALSGTVTILSGTNTASVTVSPVGDSGLEPNETVILTLSTGTGYDAGSPGSATCKILNDDTQSVTPLAAITGLNHTAPNGFSFVALDDIASGTIIYFTENSFDNTALAFTGSEGVLSWTAPLAGVTRGEVIVIEETGTNTFTASCNSGDCGTVLFESGDFSLASAGEGMFAYSDTDNNPLNGVTEVYAVLFTGTTNTPGGNIPSVEDPSSVYIGVVVVDGFAATAPNRTEYDPLKRVVDVDQADFQNTTNWMHAQTNQDLSTVPFTNIIIATGSANPTATVTVSPSSVTEDSGTGIVYTFSLNSAAVGDITINFSVGGNATFNTDYTVTGAASYTASTGSVIILNGTSSSAVTIMPTVDSDVEVQETVELMIASGTGYNGGSPNNATGSIINDDTSDSDPIVAITGLNHVSPDGFSFVAAKDIPAGTKIYFTENSFDINTLLFGSGESVLSWTSPGTVIPAGQVIVVTETGTNIFSLTRSGGSGDVGSLVVELGDFAIGTNGETLYAYEDDDNDPGNGVVDIYAVLYTGNSVTSGGTIPPAEDPSGIFLSALVVDGFPATPPGRTEYDPLKRNVLVEIVDFEDTANWLNAGANQVLSDVPFDDIQIVDIVPPDAVCQDITVYLDGTGNVSIMASELDGGSSDNVGIFSFDANISDFTCTDIGNPVSVELTVTDAAGNSATCTSMVTVIDSLSACCEAPVITCQVDVTVECDESTDPSNTGMPAYTEGCGVVQITYDDVFVATCGSAGTIERTWKATDENNDVAYCIQHITIVDNQAPVTPEVPSDLTLQCASEIPVPIELTATDNCDGEITVAPTLQITPGSCLNDFTMIRTWTFIDTCGNSSSVSQTIIVKDDVAPVLQSAMPADLNLQCASDIPAPVNLTATDNCDGEITVAPTAQITPGSCLNDFTMIRTWTFIDTCGNSSSVSQTIIVKDDVAPVLQSAMPADLNLKCVSDIPAPVNLTATDNCDGDITVAPTAQIAPGSCLNDFTMIRTWTFIDTCGNSSSVSQTIIVQDDVAPVLQSAMPADLNLQCASDVPAPVELTAIDNCEGPITVNPTIQTTPGLCVNDYTEVRTWTFTDVCGNSIDVSQTITVKDDLAPIAPSAPADITVNNIEDVPPLVDLTATDNCEGDITISPTVQLIPGIGIDDFTEIRTWTFTDQCGNSSEISQTIVLRGEVNLGNTMVYPGTTTAANRRAFPVSFSEDGLITSISIYHNGGTGQVLLGVYSDQTGSPSSLMGVTAATDINPTEGWQTVLLASPVSVATGQKVWLSWVFQNNPGVRYETGTPARAQSLGTWPTGMPSTFGASTFLDYKYSVYCTYTSVTPVMGLIVTPTSISFDSGSGSGGTFDIISNTDWNISDDATWLDVSPESGINNGMISVTANSANTGTNPRIATVNITGTGVSDKIVTVTQMPEPLAENTLGIMVVYPSSTTAANRRALPVSFNENGLITSISIYHNGGTGNVLLGVYSDQSGTPSTLLGVTAATVINPIEGWQTVPLSSPVAVASGQKVWLSWVFQNNPGVRYIAGTPARAQSSGTWSSNMPGTFGPSTFVNYKYSVFCTYTTGVPAPVMSVSPTNISLEYGLGSTGTFDITSNTVWNISDDAAWLNVSTGSGSGDETISVSANTANTGTNTRIATITITGSGVANKTVTVTQEPTPPAQTLGNLIIYQGTTTAANRRALPVSFSENGLITSLSIYHNGGTGQMLLGVYSDQSGTPSALLGVTEATVINSVEGWQTVTLASPVSVLSGQTVWLSWVFQNNPGIRYSTGSPQRAQSIDTWSSNMPGTFGTSTFANYKYSIYCTYIPEIASLFKSAEVTPVIISDKLDAFDLKVYPNPFSEKVKFEFISPEDSQVRIELYDMSGRMVNLLFDNEVTGGVNYNVEFEPDNHVSGYYIYRMTIGNETFNGRLIYKKY